MKLIQTYAYQKQISELVEMFLLACMPEEILALEDTIIESKIRLYGKAERLFALKHCLKGQIWSYEGGKIIALKGDPEAVFSMCLTDNKMIRRMQYRIEEMRLSGYHVLAVAGWRQGIERSQEDNYEFYGIIGVN